MNPKSQYFYECLNDIVIFDRNAQIFSFYIFINLIYIGLSLFLMITGIIICFNKCMLYVLFYESIVILIFDTICILPINLAFCYFKIVKYSNELFDSDKFYKNGIINIGNLLYEKLINFANFIDEYNNVYKLMKFIKYSVFGIIFIEFILIFINWYAFIIMVWSIHLLIVISLVIIVLSFPIKLYLNYMNREIIV